MPAPKTLLGGLWVQGDHLFAQDSLGGDEIGNHLLYSLAGGFHWLKAVLPTPGLGCQFDQVSSPVLWERCGTGMLAHVWVSTNNGRTFHDPVRREGEGSFANGAAFAASSNTAAVAAFQDIQRTTNSGRTCRKAPACRQQVRRVHLDLRRVHRPCSRRSNRRTQRRPRPRPTLGHHRRRRDLAPHLYRPAMTRDRWRRLECSGTAPRWQLVPTIVAGSGRSSLFAGGFLMEPFVCQGPLQG